jgi:chitinase
MKPTSKRFPRPLVVAALALLFVVVAVAGIKLLPTGSARAATTLVNNFITHYYAPYVDMTAYPTQSLTQDTQQGGIKYYSLAFITSDGNCLAAWGGVVPLSQLSTYLPNLDSDIQYVRGQGGDVDVSFGGEAGTELAQSCTSESALQAQYQSIIDHYRVSHLDFDIEGPAVTDSASIDLRNRTLAALEQANPGLVVSYTLPVLPTGLVSSGISLLQDAIADGVNVSVVNIMAMDYGSSFPGNQMGQNAVNAANSLHSQLQSLYPSKSSAQLWSMVGITPMSGANDVAGETFTTADAQTVLNFAQQNNITELALWSVNRDQPSYSYSQIFNQFNSGSVNPPPTPTPTRTGSTPTPTPTNTPVPPTPTPTPGNLVTNPGFETGTLSGWTCNATGSVVSAPVHSGSHALQLSPTSSDDAQCTQTISVQANHTYTLSAYVDGPYAFLGVNGGSSNWTSSASYSLLSVTFNTGSATSITIYVHGWYAQGNVYVDDVSLA